MTIEKIRIVHLTKEELEIIKDFYCFLSDNENDIKDIYDIVGDLISFGTVERPTYTITVD